MSTVFSLIWLFCFRIIEFNHSLRIRKLFFSFIVFIVLFVIVLSHCEILLLFPFYCFLLFSGFLIIWTSWWAKSSSSIRSFSLFKITSICSLAIRYFHIGNLHLVLAFKSFDLICAWTIRSISYGLLSLALESGFFYSFANFL